MKYKEIPVLIQNLGSVTPSDFGLKKIIAKNIRILKNAWDEIQQQLIDYEKERILLCETHSRKNEDGKALMLKNSYDIIDRDKFNKELDKLRKKHNYQSYLDYLEKEATDIQFDKIKYTDYKDVIDAMPVIIFELLMDIIE